MPSVDVPRTFVKSLGQLAFDRLLALGHVRVALLLVLGRHDHRHATCRILGEVQGFGSGVEMEGWGGVGAVFWIRVVGDEV